MTRQKVEDAMGGPAKERTADGRDKYRFQCTRRDGATIYLKTHFVTVHYDEVSKVDELAMSYSSYD